MISATENSKKIPKKPGFGRKNQFRDVVTLGPMAHATIIYMKVELWLNNMG